MELVRGPGVVDLVRSLQGEPHRTSGAFAAHVLDTLLAIQESSDTGRAARLPAYETASSALS
jgi:hypothetical protein